MTIKNRLNEILNLSFNKYRIELMGFATIWVGLMHVYSELFPDVERSLIGKIIERGNLGVEIFLLISGYGLYCSLVKTNNVMLFYKKRANRILGSWIVLGLLYWIIFGILSRRIGIMWLIYNASGLSFWISGVITIWYVSYICIIYLLYPMVYRAQQKTSSSVLVVICVIVLMNCILSVVEPQIYSNIEIAITRTPAFLMGSYIAQIQNLEKESSEKLMFVVWIYVLLTSFLFIICPFFQDSNHDIAVMLYRYGGGGIIIAVIMVLTIILEKVNLNAPLVYYGKISLEFYLISVFIRNIVSIYISEAILPYYLCIIMSLGIFIVSTIVANKSKRMLDRVVFFDVTKNN